MENELKLSPLLEYKINLINDQLKETIKKLDETHIQLFEIDKKLNTVDIIVRGVDKQNGLRSRMADLEKKENFWRTVIIIVGAISTLAGIIFGIVSGKFPVIGHIQSYF